MLTKVQKKELIKDTAEKIKASKSVVFVDFRGLKVKDMTNLKKELRSSQTSLKVIKKTLLERSLKNAGIDVDVKKMEGQIALAVSKDEIMGAKIIDRFSKTNENIKILGGLLEGRKMDAAEIKLLAKLPTKEEIAMRLIYTIKYPINSLVSVMTGNLRGLIQVLKAIAENKQSQSNS